MSVDVDAIALMEVADEAEQNTADGRAEADDREKKRAIGRVGWHVGQEQAALFCVEIWHIVAWRGRRDQIDLIATVISFVYKVRFPAGTVPFEIGADKQQIGNYSNSLRFQWNFREIAEASGKIRLRTDD